MDQRANFYAHEEYEEDLGDVNIEAVVGNYGQGGHGMYEDGKFMWMRNYDNPYLIGVDQARIDEATMAAMQHQMAQQVAFSQIPDVVKRVSLRRPRLRRRLLNCSQFIVQFHQAVLDNNLSEITNAYDQGWNRLTEKFYSKTEWPEAELIAPLVNDGELG